MFRHRLLSSLVLIPPVIGLTLLGGGWFLALVAAALALAGCEYAHLTRQSQAPAGAALVIGFGWLATLAAHYRAAELLWPGLAALALATTTWALIRFERGSPAAVNDWAFILAGGLYLGGTGAHFVLLRGLTASAPGGQTIEVGLTWAAMALACAWITDSSAYAVGRGWGRHKLAPHLSPGKTWEGYAGGLLGGVLLGGAWPGLVAALHLPQPAGSSAWHSLVACTLVAALTPLGDLGESMLKRWANVKDSGPLIPGHGGMLDRLDTLLWAAVIVYYYVRWAI